MKAAPVKDGAGFFQPAGGNRRIEAAAVLRVKQLVDPVRDDGAVHNPVQGAFHTPQIAVGVKISRGELRYRNVISFIIYFTTLFSGGLVPWYMVITKLGMKNSIWALVIPSCCSSFYILLIRNFMKTIPDSLMESAKLDGAGELLILIRIVIPLSTPILATVGLFLALAYWNDWYLASLYITDADMWPLQYRLYNILNAASKIAQAGVENFTSKILPTETQKLANAVVATGPIIFLYPFLQKYFVQGISIGAVKG